MLRKYQEAKADTLEYYKDAFRLYSQVGSSLKKEMIEKIKEVGDIEEAIKLLQTN